MKWSILKRIAAGGTISVLLTAMQGCANLSVEKVCVAQRASGTDNQEGFRYYLNRPYLVVKAPILISEWSQLVRVIPVEAKASLSDAKVEFLDGPNAGQTVRIAELRAGTPTSPSFSSISPEELKRIATNLAGQSTGTLQHADSGNMIQPVQAFVEDNGTRVSSGGVLASGDTGGTGTINTDSIDIKNVSITAPAHADALAGNLQILYLPDLDEQYTIRSRNCLSKSAFGLAFRNGSELSEVQGEHDSTTVSLALLQQVQNAIATAQGVEQAEIQQRAKSAQATKGANPGGGAAAATLASALTAKKGEQPIWRMAQRAYIKPGVYRLNKPWECEMCTEMAPVGCGLLAKLGLPTVVSVDFQPMGAINPGN